MPKTIKNVFYDGFPVRVHPFYTMDHDCPSQGIKSLLSGHGQVLRTTDLVGHLTNQKGQPRALPKAPWCVVEAVSLTKNQRSSLDESL